MPRASKIQNAFNAGEFSPLLFGRQDVKKYDASMEVCFNSLPLTQGAWTRRPGMAFLHQCKFNDRLTRVVPFQYSLQQTYVLEVGHLYIRFYTNHGILTEAAQSPTSVSLASPGVVTKASHGYSNGDRLHLLSNFSMTQLANREVVVQGATPNTFQLYDTDGVAISTAEYDAFTTGSMGKIVEVVTPYTESEIADLRWVQSADTLFLFHGDHPTAKLVRNSALSWSLTNVVFKDGPYDVTNTEATTITPSDVTGSITLTASSTVGINLGDGFLTSDVGRLMRLKHGSAWGYCEITSVSSTTSAAAAVLSQLGTTTATGAWRLGLFSDTTGYPKNGTFYEDRLWVAGADLFPQRIDGSKTGVYNSFAPTGTDGSVVADNAVGFAMNSNDVQAVQWMASNEKGLQVGTNRAEWVVRASNLSEAITPTNISGKPSTTFGSAATAPVSAGKATLFIQRGHRKLREMAYVFEADGFRSPDISVLAEHITYPGVDEITYQEQPQPVMWGARRDGAMVGVSYERDQDVVAWHRHALGGTSDSSGTHARVESLCCVASPDEVRDELYAVVQRHIGGATKRYVEYMAKTWESTGEQEDAFYVDCGWTVVNSSPSDEVTGLWFLEGETIGVYVDGTRHNDRTVTNGKIQLSRDATIVTLGYFYSSDGKTMPLEGGAQDGSSQGKTKRIHRLGIWLLDTLGLKIGQDENHLTEIVEREWGDDYSASVPLFTGIKRERFEGDYDRVAQIYWRADGPFPANVLALMPQFETQDDG